HDMDVAVNGLEDSGCGLDFGHANLRSRVVLPGDVGGLYHIGVDERKIAHAAANEVGIELKTSADADAGHMGSLHLFDVDDRPDTGQDHGVITSGLKENELGREHVVRVRAADDVRVQAISGEDRHQHLPGGLVLGVFE